MHDYIQAYSQVKQNEPKLTIVIHITPIWITTSRSSIWKECRCSVAGESCTRIFAYKVMFMQSLISYQNRQNCEPNCMELNISSSAIFIHSSEESMLTEVPLASGSGVVVSIGVAITINYLSDPSLPQGVYWSYKDLHIAFQIETLPLSFRIQ